MIKPIEKLVTISEVTDRERSLYDLRTADGRFCLADRIHKDIDEWCQQAFDDGPRSHLGASIIGGACDRHSWYVFRWFKHKVFSGRMQRLFQDGHWYEDRMIEMLRGIGCTVSQVNESGEQHRIHAVGGHFGGSTDGGMYLSERYGITEPFLAEFKTANKKSFDEMHDVQHSKPQHWGQMCVYGLKLGLRYAIYFFVGKNDADLKVEIVELDWAYGQHLIDKGEWIIRSPQPPQKLSNNPSDYRCKMCDHHAVCHMGETPDVNCRTCVHAQPTDDAQWRCNQWNVAIPNKEAALQGCSAYRGMVV